MSDMETMLRGAMETRRSKINVASTDLNKIVGEMSNAVMIVSNGHAKLVLQILRSSQQSSLYGLLFTSEDDETVIRIFEFSELGYPISCFDSLESQQNYEPRLLNTPEDLRKELFPLLSNPTSKLVRLLDYVSKPRVEIPF